MLNISNINFGYGKKGADLFHDFSLNLEAGNVYGLLGKNGAGKSTLIYLMSGLLTPQGGEVTFDGDDVRRRLPKTMNDIFLVPEEFELPQISIEKYVSINAPFYPRFSMEDMQRYLDIFEMGGNLKLKLNSLSMGQKKKVFMSFALATNTRVLIMDEPTNGFDIPGKSQFRKLISAGMTDDKMILISTHQVRDISSVLDHVVIVDKSRVLLNASIADITGRLAFRPMREGDTPVWGQQTPLGTLVVAPAQDGEETAIDLEMLFNATLDNAPAINQILTQK